MIELGLVIGYGNYKNEELDQKRTTGDRNINNAFSSRNYNNRQLQAVQKMDHPPQTTKTKQQNTQRN